VNEKHVTTDGHKMVFTYCLKGLPIKDYDYDPDHYRSEFIIVYFVLNLPFLFTG